MDYAHIHLLLTHFPIIGTLIGTGILLYGVLSKNEVGKKIAYILFVLMALLTIPVFISGGEAEEIVEHLPGVSESIIEEHEELAEAAIWLMALLGVLSIVAFSLLAMKKTRFSFIHPLTLIVALSTFGVFAKVGNLGGQIRHSEIRGEAKQATQNGADETKTLDNYYEEEYEADD